MGISKRTWFKIHGWIGVKLGILFFIVCFSGTLATLSSEIDWLLNPAIRATPQATVAPKNVISRNLEAAFPDGEITFWLGSREPYLCDIVYVQLADGKRTYAFVNPYTGVVQGSANLTVQRYLRDLHYYLFIPFQVGHFTVLVFGFLLLFALLSALLFYSKWYRKFTELKRGKGSLVLYRSLHRLVGVWAIPFLLLFSVTGIWYFLERTNTARIGDLGNPDPPVLTGSPIDSALMDGLSLRLDYDRAIDSAVAHIPGLTVKEVVPPGSPEEPLYLTGPSDVPLVRNRANRVYLHPRTYEVLQVQRADAVPVRSWLNDIADPLHFGNFGGLATKIVWFLGGLGISGLILTGLWISQKRKVRTEAQIRAQRLGPWKYVNWLLVAAVFGFMYYTLVERYRASWEVIGVITLGWGLVAFGGWYLFVHLLRSAGD